MTVTYVSGSLVRTRAVFTDVTGAPADPTVVTLKVKKGAAAPTTPSPVRDATGTYHYDVDTSGWTGPDDQLWTVQWQGSGAVVAIGDDSWLVSPPAL